MIYITIIALGFFITEFEPLHISLKWIEDKLPANKYLSYLIGALSCWQCMTFWSGLIYSHDIFTAMIASLGSVILYGWMQKK